MIVDIADCWAELGAGRAHALGTRRCDTESEMETYCILSEQFTEYLSTLPIERLVDIYEKECQKGTFEVQTEDSATLGPALRRAIGFRGYTPTCPKARI